MFFHRLRSYLVLCLVFPLVTCLAPDKSPQDYNEARTASTTTARSKAPQQIALDILRNRAFNEAPTITSRVKTGELPPTSQRLPDNPLIVVPLEEMGQYGGTIRRGLTGDIAQWPGISKSMSKNLLAFSRPMGENIEPNLAESCTFSDSGRTATIKIRKGTRWSDGPPFTVDDILFYYNDMLFDEDARSSDIPTPPPEWLVDGKPIQLSKIDTYTLQITSPRPMGRLRHTLAASGDFAAPKHYWKKFHPKYTPGADFGDFRQRTTR
ncbi:MAG: ABC transporter substrate-binding protein, partial [Candidatus Latescibacteria bacterium]|nr:ABC transporter substrate-binding protein [Candidatus Latescibacterota bacterium]